MSEWIAEQLKKNETRDYSNITVLGFEHRCFICGCKLPMIRHNAFYCHDCMVWINGKNKSGEFNEKTTLETMILTKIQEKESER
jgi:hypothetical protein